MILIDQVCFVAEIKVVHSVQQVLVNSVQIFITLGRDEADCGAILEGIISQVLLDKIEVFLEESALFTVENEITFLNNDENGDPEVDLEDAFWEGHL